MLRKRSKYFIYAAIGAAAFLLIYGTDALHVTFDGWILNGYVEEDIIQHYAGWMAFRASDWSFPVGLAGSLGYPDGVVISFTDSIPLVSVFFKCLSGILPETFQFFGWYVLFCFMMQGICAGLLMELFTEKKWGIYGAVVLFVFSPILIERAFRHTALASQWLILAALYLYFHSRRSGKTPWGFWGLQVLCVGLHPYFVPMVCGVLAAWTLEHLLKGPGAERKKAAGKTARENLTGYAGKKAYFHQPEKECADRPVTGSYRRPAYGAVIGAFLHQRKGYVPVRFPQGPVYHQHQ